MRAFGKRYLVVAMTLLGAVSSLFAQSGRPDATPPPAAPPITLTVTRLVPDAAVEIGGERHFAATPEGVWVSSRAAGTAVRIELKTNTSGKPLAIGKEPCHSLVFAFKSLWTALCSEGVLQRVNPSESDKPIAIKTAIRGAGPLVAATGGIWMITDSTGVLARIDPDTNAVVAEVIIGSGATGLAAAGDAIWVTSATKDIVTRVNAYSNVVEETIKVGRTPLAVASGEGAIWILNGGDGSVSKIDPKTNKVTETIKTGATGTTGAIAVAEGSVWLSTPGFPLSRVDPRTSRLAQQFTGPGGGMLLVAQKSIWLSATPTHVWRVDPKRVEATRK